MASGQTFYCDCCGELVNAKAEPVVCYVVVGVIGGDAPLTQDRYHPFIPAMMARRTARLELSGDCVGPVMSVLFGPDLAARSMMLARLSAMQALRAEVLSPLPAGLTALDQPTPTAAPETNK